MHAKCALCDANGSLADARWLAFRENYHVYAAPLPPAGQLELSLKMKALPMRRASDVGGDFPSWTDADTLTWTLGPALYRAEMVELFASTSPGRLERRRTTSEAAPESTASASPI